MGRWFIAALRTAASLANVSHFGVPKLAASPQLNPRLRKNNSTKTLVKNPK